MMMKLIFSLGLLIITVNASSPKTPEVHEDVKEDEHFLPENIRVARHPKLQISVPPFFDIKKITQQDPQRLRYAQQQQIDSYMRAYHHEQDSKKPHKNRKTEKYSASILTSPDQFAKTTYDTRQKSENRQPTAKQINTNRVPQQKKVDPIFTDNTQDEFKKITVPKGYKVFEDQDGEPSRKHESRVYFGKEEVVKTIQDYPTGSVNPNYLAKPTYVLANPQLSHLILDPKAVNQAASYALPSDHELSYAGFQTASKSDLEALSSLIGKAPNAQLKGLNELLSHQQGYAASAPSIAIPEHQQLAQQIVLQPQALVTHVKDHTPIKEELIDVSNTQHRPNVHLRPQNIKSNHEVKLVHHESKSVYDDHDDNLQYAAQYAFGYKIRDFHSGNNFGHEEVREGDVAKGHYHVLLPDGRIQNVEYYADPTGYHATVTYSNVAHH